MNNDNAGGGLRGLRATPDPNLLDAVREAYAIDCRADAVDLGGSSSLNLLVDAGHYNGELYVARVYRPYVTSERLNAIHLARQTLAAGGVPCGDLLATREGEAWMRYADRLVEVERYVAHDAKMDTWQRLESGLALLGRIHTLLRPLDVSRAGQAPRFANHIESTEVIQQTQRGVARMRAWQPTATELQLANDAETLARRVADAEQAYWGRLPRQLVHGDFWDNNVLFITGRDVNARLLDDGQVVHVADFDFMGVRARIDDLALTLYFACLEFCTETVSDEQLGQLHNLLDAYDAGADKPLSAGERAALPLAMARQPLWSIGGWVALLDDEQAARRHAAACVGEVAWALRLLDELARWQAALV